MKKLILAITLLAAFPAQAQLTGLQLEEYCEAEEGSFTWGLCTGYFSGYRAGSAVWRGMLDIVDQPPPPIMPCTDQASTLVMVRVWLKHIEENPEKLDYPPRFSILQAMIESFPCEE